MKKPGKGNKRILKLRVTPDGPRLWPSTKDPSAAAALRAKRRILVRYINANERRRIVRELREIAADGTRAPITLIFDSWGGYLPEANLLIEAIRAIPKSRRVVGVALRIHSSAISVFLACGHRVATRGSGAMMHFTRQEITLEVIASTRHEMRRAMNRQIVDLWRLENKDRRWIAARTGLSVRKVTGLARRGEIDEETINATRLVELGFARRVIPHFEPLLSPPVRRP